MSMISFLPLFGSFAQGAIIPDFYHNYQDFGETFRIGFFVDIVCFVILVTLVLLDFKTEEYDTKLLKEYIATNQTNIPEAQ